MRVKELMTKKVLTVSPDDDVVRAFAFFHKKKFRHLPIVDKGKVVGILSDRDIKKLLNFPKGLVANPGGTTFTIAPTKIKSIMGKRLTTKGLITIEPEKRVADAATIMVKRKIGALPVVRKGKLVGIITETDILKAIVELFDVIEPFMASEKKRK